MSGQYNRHWIRRPWSCHSSAGFPVWKAVVETLRHISIHQFSPQAIRSGPKIGGEVRLSHDGHNAGDVLKHLKAKDKEWIEQHLAAAVPGIREVWVKTVVGRRIIGFAQECGNGHAEQFDASVMSDGTLRSLGSCWH